MEDTGLCLHFDTSVDPSFFQNVLPIHYMPEIKTREYNPISEPNHIVDLFYKKTMDWSHEKELRLLKDRTGRISFDTIALKNVIVGYKADKKFISEVIQIVKKLYPKVPVYQIEGSVTINRLRCNLLYG